MAPAKGCPIPHNRFCSASENANTSRPQSLACEMGVRKNPRAERGRNDTTEIRQPQIAMSAILRVVITGRIRSAMDISYSPKCLLDPVTAGVIYASGNVTDRSVTY